MRKERLKHLRNHPEDIFSSTSAVREFAFFLTVPLHQLSSDMKAHRKALIGRIAQMGPELITLERLYTFISAMPLEREGNADAYTRKIKAYFGFHNDLLQIVAGSSPQSAERLLAMLLDSLSLASRPLHMEEDVYFMKLAITLAVQVGIDLFYITTSGKPQIGQLGRIAQLMFRDGVTRENALILFDLIETLRKGHTNLILDPRPEQYPGHLYFLRLPKGFYEKLEPYREEINVRTSALLAELTQMVQDNLEVLVELSELLWQDIIARRRTDVRLFGLDHFRVAGILGKIDGESRYFVREGAEFPGVGVAWQSRLWRGTMYWASAVMMSPESFQGIIAEEQLTLGLVEAGVQGFSCMALPSFLANLIAYHHIVCAPARSQVAKGGAPRGRKLFDEASDPEALTFVRPYIRQLAPGWQPSPEKVAEARRRLFNLPEGFTFVTDHRRALPESTVDEAEIRHRYKHALPPAVFTVSLEDVLSYFK